MEGIAILFVLALIVFIAETKFKDDSHKWEDLTK